MVALRVIWPVDSFPKVRVMAGIGEVGIESHSIREALTKLPRAPSSIRSGNRCP